ncbi:hypothetical protein CL659_04210 [bacterium]|nr:hypothetical protein [bacterium]|tara:strand:+ start:9922 stop:10830 length:909 start_codon:yes stop_codon:yes gene_type:complete
MKFALAGNGKMGKLHYSHLIERKDLELVAVIDPNEKALLSLDEKIKKYTDFKNFDEKIDALIVATPTKYHEKITNHFLKKNVHILVEKPIAKNMKEAKSMVKNAKQMNRVLMIGYIERHNPMIKALSKLIKSEEIESIYASRWAPRPARITSEGVVLDSMIHDIDIVLQLLNKKVKMKDAFGNLGADGYPDNAKITLETKDNQLAHLFSGWETTLRHRTICVTTQKNIYLGDYIKKTLTKIDKQHNKKEKIPVHLGEMDAINYQITKFKNNVNQKKYYQESLDPLEIVLKATKKIISDNKND